MYRYIVNTSLCVCTPILNLNFFGYTGLFIMYSRITKIYYRKSAGHIFTKPVQIEGTTQKDFFPVGCFSC